MNDLFSAASKMSGPLPHRMRPDSLQDYLGQEKLIQSLKQRPLHSMILYGPPGCGKTTLARILASQSRLSARTLSAISSGIKDVREVIEEGKASLQLYQKPVLLVIDEIHRFSKSQQDSLLEAVESGWILLIGLTTENPSFEVIAPLLSRCRTYRLQSLSDENLIQLLQRSSTLDPEMMQVDFTEKALQLLLTAAAGDARKFLGIAELAARGALAADFSGASGNAMESSRNVSGSKISITEEHLLEVLQENRRTYDRAGKEHYDTISALIKSMRGSDPDGALLYLAIMIDGGEDPLFIARRMIIFASEDIGNAYPEALQMAVSAFQALERIGMPEGRIVLGQLATYLASVPRSNAAYLGINEALEAVRGKQVKIPLHLRNAPTKTQKDEGAGTGYLYPHDFPEHFVKQNYLPEEFREKRFYRPTSNGHESRMRERLMRLFPERKY